MTSTIIFKTDPKLKSDAQKVAASLGLTLSSVLNNSLRDLVEKESASFGSPKIKYTDPYGSMSGKFISMKQIKKPVLDWQKRISEIG